MENKIFAKLNPAQKDAVETLSGPLLILAGAGSGKTKTLTHRIANLVAHAVMPYEILALTFTNKAAKEMRSRLWSLLNDLDKTSNSTPPFNFMPWMGTFHGICVKILRMEAENVGLSKNFVIYDTDDRLALIKRSMKTLSMSDKTLKPKAIEAAISKSKNAGLSPDEYLTTAYYPNQKQIAEVYKKYESARKKANAVDFDDILLEVAKLLKNRPDIRAKWQQKFKHILIDEYQDTNHIQYEMVRLLVNPERNICVVGDDWQSIYSWRGADFTNILNFEKDFPGAKIIKLEQNYRSTGNILKASQKIITKNSKRSEKALFTEAGSGAPISIERLTDEQAEAEWVSGKILATKRDYSDFAILYRTNAQSSAFERAFMLHRIPYKLIGGVRFYDRKEIKDILAYLHLIINPADTVALQRITNIPTRGIGEASLTKILAGDTTSLTPKISRAYTSFQNLLKDLRAKNASETTPDALIEAILARTRYKEYINNSDPLKAEERIENLGVLIGEAAAYSSLSEFLADAALMSSADESSANHAVTLMTLHAAKGLEFPVVFLVGLEEGLLPHIRSAEAKEEDLEEERRLAYVGMTRAMEELLLSFAASRFTFGGRNYNFPSRFLTDLGYDPYGLGQGNTDDFGATDDPFPPDDLPTWT
ncbi:MAG: UvrD-helicase domain-containing protein [Candidatus Nomurabacteria bacterium]|jgi:DNA helicase-2/ATP-dependent DNA helicase PcrA|nr:UvrD-helicase domain-containing protein [Candidatus Nomurabacteria bacterium]